ncbi:hypothetical protein AtEden1_Chr3g0199721 [Arabidopsis thaliana]
MDTKKLFDDFLSACRDLHLQDLMDMELWFLYNPRLIESPVITDVRPSPPRPYGHRNYTKFLR